MGVAAVVVAVVVVDVVVVAVVAVVVVVMVMDDGQTPQCPDVRELPLRTPCLFCLSDVDDESARRLLLSQSKEGLQ